MNSHILDKKSYWTLWTVSTICRAISALMMGIILIMMVLLYIGKIQIWGTLGGWLAWAIYMTASYFSRNCLWVIALNGQDIPEDERIEAFYRLQRWFATGIGIIGISFSLELIRGLGDSMRNLNSNLNWAQLIFGLLCLWISWKWHKSISEKTAVPTFLLTWPAGAGDRVPMPKVPEQEREPRRLH